MLSLGLDPVLEAACQSSGAQWPGLHHVLAMIFYHCPVCQAGSKNLPSMELCPPRGTLSHFPLQLDAARMRQGRAP